MLECHELEIVSASTNILSRQCWGPAKRYATPRVRERTANYLSHTAGQRAYRITGRLEFWTLPLSSVYQVIRSQSLNINKQELKLVHTEIS